MPKVTYVGAAAKFGIASVLRFREGHDPAKGKVLDPRFDLRRHSPDGFAWGYGGSGPAQLSLAILADYFGSDRRATRLYQDFKFAVIAGLPQSERWILTDLDIDQTVARIEQKRGWVWNETSSQYEDQIAMEDEVN